MLERANIVIVGGGVVGLAIAAELSKDNDGVFVFEKNKRLGQEASSHNSGVVHSGIHYPKNSLKAKMCVAGNKMIYDICTKGGIPFKKLGKLTVANEEGEFREIELLRRQGEENGVEGLEVLDAEGVREMEPAIRAEQALYSPSSGIIEPDYLLEYYESVTKINEGVIATDTEVKSIRKRDTGYELGVRNGESNFSLMVNTVINSAGLSADRIAQIAGMDTEALGYRLHLCKGDYFRIADRPPVKHLVYPVPEGPGLGIHLTPDLSGSVKMGPNAYYVSNIGYSVESSVEDFRKDVSRYLPSIINMRIKEDSSGVRPKLQGPGEGFRDFVIREEGDKGFPGFYNLIGIESPGLTASPAIASYVSALYADSA